MSFDFLNSIYIKIIKILPMLTIFLFIIVDSIPFHFFEFNSIETQFGLIVVYSWLCCNHKKVRPALLVFCGILIDLFNSMIFGLTSLTLIILFLIQRNNYEFLMAKEFTMTWLRLGIFVIIYNFFSFFLHNFYERNIDYDLLNIIFSIFFTIILFPLIFSLINYFNNKIKYLHE